jgi:hypothetical protein
MLRCSLFFVLFFTNTVLDAQPPVLQIEPKNVSALRISGGVLQKENFFAFDGNTGMIEFNSDYQLSGDFSIVMLISPEERMQTQTLLLKGELCPDGNGNINGLSLITRLTGDMRLSGTILLGMEAPFGSSSFTSGETLSSDSWQQITVVYNSENYSWKAFLDENELHLEHSIVGANESVRNISESKGSWKIGTMESYCDFKHHFEEFYKGSVRSVKIYDYKLSAKQIDKMANSEFYIKSVLLTISGLATLIVGLLILRRVRQRSISNTQKAID